MQIYFGIASIKVTNWDKPTILIGRRVEEGDPWQKRRGVGGRDRECR